MNWGFNPVPKPVHKRRRRKRAYITRITPQVRKEILRRVEEKFGYQKACERCGRSDAFAYEMAHLVNASQLGRGSEPWNIALLCGPKVNSGTCHNWADETAEGREWKKQYQQELKEYYREA